jgi:hypothetical protein
MTLAVLYTHQAKASRRDVMTELERRGKPAATTPALVPSASNAILPTLPAAGTNAAPAAATPVPVTAPPPAAAPAAAIPAAPAGSTNAPGSPGR